jgi:hypothetical protein
MQSNLSKIKPKLRTEGRVSGNFGHNKVRAGSSLTDIGYSSKDVVRIPAQDAYLSRLYEAFDKTTEPKLKNFLYLEIRKILTQRGLWKPQ